MRRRRFLASACAAPLATYGCLSSGSEGDVVLPPQENQFADSEDLPYLAHGQKYPEFVLQDPVNGVEYDSSEIDRVTLTTGIYTTCPAECVMIGNLLAGVQHDVNDAGLEDQTMFVTISFDPERDDAEALEDYGRRMGVDMEAGNWRFLLPEDEERAEEVVTDGLGIPFEPDGGGGFTHLVLTLLVNPDGYVERAYRGDQIDMERVVEDVKTVADAYF